MNFTPEQLAQLRQKIPSDIVDAIASYDFGFTVEEIGGKYDLLISETNEVYQLVIKVITGITSPRLFQDELTKALPDQDSETVEGIVHDVDEQIFKKLKEHLIKTFENKVSVPDDDTVHPEHREAILEEIEDHTPTPVMTAAAVAPTNIDIVGNKLQETVQTSQENVTIVANPQKKYTADPYREPI